MILLLEMRVFYYLKISILLLLYLLGHQNKKVISKCIENPSKIKLVSDSVFNEKHNPTLAKKNN